MCARSPDPSRALRTRRSPQVVPSAPNAAVSRSTPPSVSAAMRMSALIERSARGTVRASRHGDGSPGGRSCRIGDTLEYARGVRVVQSCSTFTRGRCKTVRHPDRRASPPGLGLGVTARDRGADRTGALGCGTRSSNGGVAGAATHIANAPRPVGAAASVATCMRPPTAIAPSKAPAQSGCSRQSKNSWPFAAANPSHASPAARPTARRQRRRELDPHPSTRMVGANSITRRCRPAAPSKRAQPRRRVAQRRSSRAGSASTQRASAAGVVGWVSASGTTAHKPRPRWSSMPKSPSGCGRAAVPSPRARPSVALRLTPLVTNPGGTLGTPSTVRARLRAFGGDDRVVVTPGIVAGFLQSCTLSSVTKCTGVATTTSS